VDCEDTLIQRAPPRAPFMRALFVLFAFLSRLEADGVYNGPKFQQGLRRVRLQSNLEIL